MFCKHPHKFIRAAANDPTSFKFNKPTILPGAPSMGYHTSPFAHAHDPNR